MGAQKAELYRLLSGFPRFLADLIKAGSLIYRGRFQSKLAYATPLLLKVHLYRADNLISDCFRTFPRSIVAQWNYD